MRVTIYRGDVGVPITLLTPLPMTDFLRIVWRELAARELPSFDAFAASASFHDADGTVVVFVPDALPDGERLHLRLNVTPATLAPSFRWDAAANAALLAGTEYLLSVDGLTASTRHQEGKRSSMHILCADRPMTEGTHSFEVQFSHSALAERVNFGDDFRLFPLFEKCLRLGVGRPKVRVTVDMTARTATFTSTGDPSSNIDGIDARVIDNLPAKVWAAVAMTSALPCSATIASLT